MRMHMHNINYDCTRKNRYEHNAHIYTGVVYVHTHLFIYMYVM